MNSGSAANSSSLISTALNSYDCSMSPFLAAFTSSSIIVFAFSGVSMYPASSPGSVILMYIIFFVLKPAHFPAGGRIMNQSLNFTVQEAGVEPAKTNRLLNELSDQGPRRTASSESMRLPIPPPLRKFHNCGATLNYYRSSVL